MKAMKKNSEVFFMCFKFFMCFMSFFWGAIAKGDADCRNSVTHFVVTEE